MIEQFMEILWWALAAGAPFLVGNMGGSQPSPPTLDTNQSKALTQADYDLKQKNIPGLVETTGKAGREEYARTTAFALRGFTDPSSIYQGEIEDLREGRKKAQGQLDALTGARQSSNRWGKTYLVDGKWLGERDYKKRVAETQRRVDRSSNQIRKLQNSDPVKDLQRAFRKEFRLRDNLLGDMRSAKKSTKEYNRMQRALQKGLNAQTVGQRSANAAQAEAAGAAIVRGPRAALAENVKNIRSGYVRSGALGQELMSRAIEGVRSGGRLNAEAERDAVQAARQSMAARGMATGSAGAAAELLNRDRFRRAREMEDLAFASGVQGQNLERQFQNVGNQLTARQANQAKDLQLSLNDQDAINQMRALGYEGLIGQRQFNAANQQQANLANMQALNNMRQFNVGLAADTDRFNAAQRTDAQRFNVGMLQSSALAADNERARQLGLGQSAYNFALQTNPKLMLAGLGSPYANFTPQALGLMNNTNVQPIYSGGQLGSPGVFQTVMGTVGQVAQAGGQAAQAYYSDKRMKKDIKPVGKDGVLGLKTYEYRYKGESKDAPKHTGYMAQEVRKVMPEAVEEFNYRGKKRLAIKPAVIGQALTEALAEQQRNMFADGYVVGSGFGG